MNIQHASKQYYRAIWALDSAGFTQRVNQHWLMKRWDHCARISAMHGNDPDLFGGEIQGLIDESERCIKVCEKDHDRPEWEKQRDYLIGVVKRCIVAANTQQPPEAPRSFLQRMFAYFKKDTQLTGGMSNQELSFMTDLAGKLHYYMPFKEDFNADLGVGYFLWQGLRAELKQGITLANIAETAHPDVVVTANRMRDVIRALEHGETDGLEHYEKSKLNLSEEQHRKRLWEGVVTELEWIVKNNGKSKR
jgi:hypothetical protein